MNEKNYDFVEEVIRKRPSKFRYILSKLPVLLLLVALICFVAAAVSMLIERYYGEDWLEAAANGQGSTASKLNMTVEDEEQEAQTSLVGLEEKIDRSMVALYKIEGAGDERELLCTGTILAMEEYIYILVPYDKIGNRENVVARFFDGSTAEIEYWNHDEALKLGLVRVDRADVEEDTWKEIECVTIGNADTLNKGIPFVYVGNPFGGQVLTYAGNVAGIEEDHDLYDLYFRTIYTDIIIEDVEDGFLFDYHANLIGFVSDKVGSSKNQTISAILIYDLYDLLTKLLNLETSGYLGIKGNYVNYEITKYVGQEIPEGLYITSLDNTGAAYQAGVMTGDVITKVGDVEIEGMKDLRKSVNSRNPGDIIEITLERKIGDTYKEMTLQVTIGRRK